MTKRESLEDKKLEVSVGWLVRLAGSVGKIIAATLVVGATSAWWVHSQLEDQDAKVQAMIKTKDEEQTKRLQALSDVLDKVNDRFLNMTKELGELQGVLRAPPASSTH